MKGPNLRAKTKKKQITNWCLQLTDIINFLLDSLGVKIRQQSVDRRGVENE